jgi:predicted ArsR family transcriptional regulator
MTPTEALTKASLAFLPTQYRKTILALSEEPMSCEELAEKLETSLEYARLILNRLHKAKVACVVHWRRTPSNGMPTKMWGLGTRDEKQPPKLTRAEISKRHRDNRRGLSGEIRLGLWGL